MAMTWRHLENKIKEMSDEEKDCDVTIHDLDQDEYFAVKRLMFAKEKVCNVLDDGHPYLE